MSSRLPRHAVLAVTGICVVLSAAAGAQQRTLYDRYTEPIEIFSVGLGTFTKPTSSTNKEAQAFFDQSFQMMYSFATPEAVRSFRDAWKRDPKCAICYWGEAWAWGFDLELVTLGHMDPVVTLLSTSAMADRLAKRDRDGRWAP